MENDIKQEDSTNTTNPTQTSTNNTTDKLPSAFTLYKPSWAALKLNIGTFITLLLGIPLAMAAVLLVPVLLIFVSNGSDILNIITIIIGIIMVVAFIIVGVILSGAVIYTQIQSAKGKAVDVKTAWSVGRKVALKLIILQLAVGLFIFIGFILLIVPGIIAIRRYYLSQYYLVDKQIRFNEAMKLSADHSKKTGGIWGILGVNILNNVPSTIPFVGWFVSGILSLVYYNAPAIRYLQIESIADSNPNNSKL